MTKRVAIVNLSERRGADIELVIDDGENEAEVIRLEPGDRHNLDRDDLEHVRIRDVPGRGTERFVGEKTGKNVSPDFSIGWRATTNQWDTPKEPEANDES